MSQNKHNKQLYGVQMLCFHFQILFFCDLSYFDASMIHISQHMTQFLFAHNSINYTIFWYAKSYKLTVFCKTLKHCIFLEAC